MKAEFEYTEGEVEAIVLEHHAKSFTAPVGMKWAAEVSSYGLRRVKVVAVEKEPE